jgi:hypothetical protein
MMKLMVVASMLAALAAGRAGAQELVTNGGFETGSFTGWTEFGDSTYIGVDGFHPHSGAFMAYFGPLAPGGIQQTLAANIGDLVHVSFFYRSEGGLTPNSLSVTLGSLTVYDVTNVTSTNYLQASGDFLVADTNPALRFTFFDEPDYLDLDDVSVTVVPGPASGMALAVGLAAVGRRQRRARVS